MLPVPGLEFRLSPQGLRAVHVVLWVGAALGLLLGLETVVLHLSTDPLSDARVYYDAGARLNAGLPLYDATASDSIGLYLNPPLLAILFRPLALLPFPAAAAVWMVMMLGSLAFVFRRIGLGRWAVLLTCWLALPIGWALSVGQAEPIVTLLLAIGSPAAIALAGNLKLVPLLIAVHWAARRDWRSLGWLLVWAVGIAAVQVLVEPSGSLAFLQLTWLRPAFDVRNVSPFAIHPAIWLAMLAVLAAVAWGLSRSRYGWAAAVLLAGLSYPRLLVYQLMSLLAVLGGPRAVDASREANT